MTHRYIHISCKNHSTIGKGHEEREDEREKVFHLGDSSMKKFDVFQKSWLFSCCDIPSPNQFFDKILFFLSFTRKSFCSTTREMVLEEFSIGTLKKSHGSIDLVSYISTVDIVIDHLLNLRECTKCLLDIELYFIF